MPGASARDHRGLDADGPASLRKPSRRRSRSSRWRMAVIRFAARLGHCSRKSPQKQKTDPCESVYVGLASPQALRKLIPGRIEFRPMERGRKPRLRTTVGYLHPSPTGWKYRSGVPTGIRTPVIAVKGPLRPRKIKHLDTPVTFMSPL